MNRREFLQRVPAAGRGLGARMVSEISGIGWAQRVVNAVATKPSSGTRVAVLDPQRCLAYGGLDCQLCYVRCPQRDAAICLQDGCPVIMRAACDGCGACVEACSAVNNSQPIVIKQVE